MLKKYARRSRPSCISASRHENSRKGRKIAGLYRPRNRAPNLVHRSQTKGRSRRRWARGMRWELRHILSGRLCRSLEMMVIIFERRAIHLFYLRKFKSFIIKKSNIIIRSKSKKKKNYFYFNKRLLGNEEYYLYFHKIIYWCIGGTSKARLLLHRFLTLLSIYFCDIPCISPLPPLPNCSCIRDMTEFFSSIY